jgi:hypothetical protein
LAARQFGRSDLRLHTELALATTRVAALRILAEGCAAIGVDSAAPPELELGFRVLLAETYTVSFESFAEQAEFYLREQGALPEISALLGSVAGSLAAGETLYSVRERVLHQVTPFASLASTAWRQIVPHTPEELLDRVVDRATFLDFASALASERAWADELEAQLCPN